MEKATKAELIAALVTDKFSGFKVGDEALLESCADTRLEEFRSASEGHKSQATTIVRLETENRNTNARLKVAEDRIRTAESAMTEEDFLKIAPPQYKEIIEAHQTEVAQTRAALVSQLKDLGAHTEEELKAKPLDELKALAQYARVSVPDFSGRGVATSRNASERVSYAPPDPYADALKKLRTVN